MAAASESGETESTTAKRLALPLRRIRLAKRDLGIADYPATRSNHAFKILYSLLFGAETYQEFANRFGVSRQRVGQIAKAARDAGFTVRKESGKPIKRA